LRLRRPVEESTRLLGRQRAVLAKTPDVAAECPEALGGRFRVVPGSSLTSVAQATMKKILLNTPKWPPLG
jgi:hypothetical protein